MLDQIKHQESTLNERKACAPVMLPKEKQLSHVFYSIGHSTSCDVKTAKVSHYSSTYIQSEGYSRKTWQTNNELNPIVKNYLTVKELTLNDVISNSSELCNTFNEYASQQIGSRLTNDIPPVGNHDPSCITYNKIM